MDIKKDTITYRGREYPCADIALTEAEAAGHDMQQGFTFADEGLLRDMMAAEGIDPSGFTGEARDIDLAVDYYMDDGTCGRYCAGEIPDPVMKVKVAREILSWL